MTFFFTPYELNWLDDLSPEEYRRQKEDKRKRRMEAMGIKDHNGEVSKKKKKKPKKSEKDEKV